MSIIDVTTGQVFATVSDAISGSGAGDVIQVSAGTYSEDFPKITHSLTIQGVGGMAHLTPVGTVGSPSNGMGVLVIDAPDVTLDHLEISGAEVPDNNGAGIRFETGNTLTITNCWLHDNQDGMLANPGLTTTITIDHSEFNNNGIAGGQTHNLYVNTVAQLTITNSYFHDAQIGHEIKSRALNTVITGNRIEDGMAPDLHTSYAIDLPDGGIATVTGNVIQKGPSADQGTFIHFGGEFPLPVASLAISNNVVIDDNVIHAPNFLLNEYVDSLGNPVVATVNDNTFYGLGSDQLGNALTVQGNLFPGGSGPTLDTSHPFSIACFVAGTRIAVPGGDVAVEDLRIGDLVVTASGGAKAVKWLGRRRYDAAQVAANAQLHPVLIRKNAIHPGLPCRDLRLSPLHALLIENSLVPAVALVNGVSVMRDRAVQPVSYIHIELDEHDIILSEGLPVETFADDSSRLMFDNADEYFALYGTNRAATGFSAPRVEEGAGLEVLRRRIAERAGVALPGASQGKLRGHAERIEHGTLHGWMFDTEQPGEPVELEILVEGNVVASALANRYRVDLDFHGLADGRAGFTVVVPESVTSLDRVSIYRASPVCSS